MLDITSDSLSSDTLSIVLNDVLAATSDIEVTQIVEEASQVLALEQFSLLIEAIPMQQRLVVWNAYSEENQQSSFVLMGDDTRTWLMDKLTDSACFELLAQLDVEHILELAEDLPDRFLSYAIKQLDESQRALFQQAQQFDNEQIGHWLDYDYVRISEKLKVSSAKRIVAKGLSPYTDTFYTVNKEGLLTGCVSVNDLLAADESALLADLIDGELVTLQGNEALYESAEKVIMSDKMALPVIDENGHFIGRIHIASAYEIRQEQIQGQINNAAGLREDEDLFSSVKQSAQNRGVWLGINLATAFLASWFIGLFEATLQQVVALAVLMPVVASMGGISGSQTLTVIVRGLALGQITEANRNALLQKELKVGAVNGVIWSLVIGVITYYWFDNSALSFVIGFAILLNLIAASVSGVIIPSVLDKLKIDPALSGSVVLTTVTDIVGFVVFLGLGRLLLL
ncbi:magnesium transporter [Algibacillus agarilyticus]|uniref:magnesium transporter n=1 Tax=Algibacillus agarilyticus TaxID=2234133 RepID=UPI000DD0B35C|nr:magnesium transporter [Algibacillus agarilyticus]